MGRYDVFRNWEWSGANKKAAQMASPISLCSTEDVLPGAALRVDVEGLSLAVFNLDGEYFVLDDTCSHGPGSLSEGYIEVDIVECNFHGGQFNIKTGEVVSPPCVIPQRSYPATIVDGKVTIEL
jgi:biphenyl 2,3-dioxygenase ferredoxin subunit